MDSKALVPALLLRLLLLSSHTNASGPYYVLNPDQYAGLLGEDFAWAKSALPLFESSSADLTRVFYFRARVLRSHVHATNRTDGIPSVITEFAPDVSWAGAYNTIICASGHHLSEAGWLRGQAVASSYARWWASNESQHNYFSWHLTLTKRATYPY